MDQSRLEELKRLLQKRHQEPKRGLEQNSNGENFKVTNFETQNSEASNFEASNFEILNSEPLNSRAPNSEASNSETLNSNPGALNLKAELEAKADQNSAYENNAEPQNFILDDSDSLQQNSKARDYDKEPIVIKDHTYYEFMIYQFPALLVGFIIFLTFATIVNPVSLKTFRMLPSILVLLLTVIRDKDGMYFEFKNDKILYYYKNKIRKIFELNSIGAMIISFDCRHSMRGKG
ncbi:hypothetical protein [uncultured Campylobacter sp.]|uniref:hypothetical protein n=1 Tax=uncultured Campylobacter sp. TaxID=218934 RepID=UPI00261E9D12|nr:hypothetical protein [uncultured Campylobacter sp.]